MVGFREVYCKYRFDVGADRLGPDMPFSHWRLYFRRVGRELCLRKFKRFGKGAEFRPGAYAVTCSRIEIGDRVTIRPQSMLFADPRPDGSGIIIEDDVLLGSGVHIYTVNHRFDDTSIPISEQGHSLSRTVVLESGCWIGANVTILPGITIGQNAVVGAGSVVTKPLAARAVYAGSPAKLVRVIEEQA